MTFEFTVVLDTDTLEHAWTVMTERLGHDEDYGFEYRFKDYDLRENM